MTFRLPIRPTDIEMGYEPAAEGRGPERTLVRLTKPGFFDLSFWIEPQGSTSAVPAGLRVSDEQVKHIATHGFLITLKVPQIAFSALGDARVQTVGFRNVPKAEGETRRCWTGSIVP